MNMRRNNINKNSNKTVINGDADSVQNMMIFLLIIRISSISR